MNTNRQTDANGRPGEIALVKAGSVLDWRTSGMEYVADGYRIRLVEPRKWEITHEEATIGYDESRAAAFNVVEDHRREAIRRGDLIRLAIVFALTTLAGAILSSLVPTRSGWVIVLGPLIFYIAVSSLIRFVAVFFRNPNDPYRRPLPWERFRWQERLFFGKH